MGTRGLREAVAEVDVQIPGAPLSQNLGFNMVQGKGFGHAWGLRKAVAKLDMQSRVRTFQQKLSHSELFWCSILLETPDAP